MAISPFLCVLSAAAFLFLCASPGWSATQEPSSAAKAGPSAVDGLAAARKLVRAGRFDDALAMLRPLARGRRVDADVLFQIGMAAIGASQKRGVSEDARDALLDEAIAAFHTMLVGRPGLIRVRLELARAFFLKGEDKLARSHFEQVLAGKPPAAVALNVNRVLNIMRARKRWSLRLGAALAPDSNISARTDERTILLDTPIGRLPFTFRAADEPESGIGISVWASGEYQYPLEERWRLRAGADFSRREYRSDEFDRMTVGGHVGPRWLIGRASEASLLASVRQSWLADEPEYRDLGIRIEGQHRINRRTTVSLNASRYERRYDVSTAFDGPLTDISAGVGWVAAPTMRIDAAAGWGSQRTERERYRHTRHWVQLGTTVLLPLGLHGERGRHAELDRLQGQLVSIRPRRRAAPRPDPLDPAQRLQPGCNPRGFQPAGLGGAGTAQLQRPAPRLRAPLGRAAVRAPVLTGGPCSDRVNIRTRKCLQSPTRKGILTLPLPPGLSSWTNSRSPGRRFWRIVTSRRGRHSRNRRHQVG